MSTNPEQVLAAIGEEPRTLKEIAAMLGKSRIWVWDVICPLQLEAKVSTVSKARENGITVSRYMATGTEMYARRVAEERVRIADLAERWESRVLAAVPDDEVGDLLEDIVEVLCADLDHDAAEGLRADGRAVFHVLLGKGLLCVDLDVWRRAPHTEK